MQTARAEPTSYHNQMSFAKPVPREPRYLCTGARSNLTSVVNHGQDNGCLDHVGVEIVVPCNTVLDDAVTQCFRVRVQCYLCAVAIIRVFGEANGNSEDDKNQTLGDLVRLQAFEE